MDDISKIIYKEYKDANIITILAKNKMHALGIRSLIISIIFIMFILYIKFQARHPILTIIALIIFMLLVFIAYDKAIKNISEKNNMNCKLTSQKIARLKLKDILLSHKMFTKEGVEYLITIYTKRNRFANFLGVPIMGIVFSTIISNIIYLIMFCTNEESKAVYTRVALLQDLMKLNLDNIIALILLIFILFIPFIFLFKDIKVFFSTIFGFGYDTLLYDLEYVFLPSSISHKQINKGYKYIQSKNRRRRKLSGTH